jgi:beta-glucanase (GH16 family)
MLTNARWSWTALMLGASLTLGCGVEGLGAEDGVGDVSDSPERVGEVQEALTTGWMLTFVDNFDGSTLDRDNWQPMNLPAGAFNSEWQRYEDSEGGSNGTFDVSNGALNLRVRYAGGGFNGYRSARLVSKNKVEKAQGAWEARLWFWKSSGAAGLWPAFWLLGARINQAPLLHSDENLCWPSVRANEIDVMEFVSNTGVNQGNFIKDWGAGCEVYDSRNYVTPLSVSAYEPHVYRVEWKADVLRLMVDGAVYRTLYGSDWQGIWHDKYFVILNTAIGGTLGGGVAFGPGDYAGMSVDYVRHYSWSNDAPTFPDSNKSYKIKTIWDNYVLTGKDENGNNERPTMVMDNDWTSQRWRFIPAGGGYYYIQNVWSGKNLQMKDEYGNYNAPPFNVTAETPANVASQKFELNVDGAGKYTFPGGYGPGLTSVEANNDPTTLYRRAAGRTLDTSKSSHRWIVSATD